MKKLLIVVGGIAVLWWLMRNSWTLKPGASVDGTHDVVLFGIDVAAGLRRLLGGGELVVTAGSDSHPPGDVHTAGYAADLRTNDLSAAIVETWYRLLRAVLGPLGFDVVLETHTGTGPHIHIEYQPRGARGIPGVPGFPA